MARNRIPAREFLVRLPLFAELAETERERIAAAATEVDAPRGTVLFRRGDPCTGMHVVIHGQVKLALQTEKGEEKVIELVGPGQSFGDAVMFLEQPYMVTAETLTDTKLVHIGAAVLFEEIDRDPHFARRIIASLARRLHRLMGDLEGYTMHSGRERVIKFLLGHLPVDEDPNGGWFTLPAKKGIIASRLNLTHEHFSRILHDLAGSGLILVNGRQVAIPDAQRLREQAH